MSIICSVVFIEFSHSRSLPKTSVTSSSMTNSDTVFLHIQKNDDPNSHFYA